MKYITSCFFAIVIVFLTTFTANSQLLLNPNGAITPAQAVQEILIGAGIQAFNITFNGSAPNSLVPTNSVREFNAGATTFPIQSGVLMQTEGAPSVFNDADLVALAGQNVTNGVIIEFDFIPQGDTLSFNYIFASAEYTSYTCSNFNDVFGFFISGPGITGPYSSNSVNIATVPGGTIPVGINTVNGGAPTGGGSAFNCSSQDPNWQANAVYFTTSYNPIFTATNGVANFNGATIVLAANSTMFCGQVYHIKMALANAVDQALDSGVFLEATSFTINPNSLCGIISGSVFLDNNSNCSIDFFESGQQNYNIAIEPGGYIATTGPGGFWYIDELTNGNYTATIDTTNLNWLPTCPITQSFTVTNPNVFTAGPDFGLISTNPCSDPSVSIYAPFLRPCLPNQMIYVQACNQTTATGILNASYVDVELDPLMTVTASSIPYTLQSANVYRFQTGNLNPGQCANFSISTFIGSPAVGCATLLGQTLCMDANLYPVQSCALDNTPSNPPSGGGGSTGGGTLDGLPEPCTLPWDQSSLSVDGWCQNDTIYFTITNTGELGGGDMECYSPLWVTVDGVVTYTDSIMIQGGQTITYSFPGDGATWILNAAQHPLHPGNSNPNAHVEACGDLSNWTPDLVNDFPQDDADPVVDIYCGIVTGSYDPNDKTGYPYGVTEQRYIQPDQHLQYVIRFQNTGTDTAFTVVIRDTLDIDLNIFTVTPGVSSHNYEFRMYGPRVLEWTFNNILLPDSTTNEPESNGFVTFQVQQVPNLAPGTEIKNAADIYFDFNDPIRTNTTIHRIYEGFVNVATLEELSKEKSRILVYPNPSNGIITVVLKDKDNSNYDIFDQMGRIVKSGSLDEKKTNIQLDLQNGMYYLKVGDAVVKVQIR
jgi:uncharacterized repeat protein (TIGR01451 family)